MVHRLNSIASGSSESFGSFGASAFGLNLAIARLSIPTGDHSRNGRATNLLYLARPMAKIASAAVAVFFVRLHMQAPRGVLGFGRVVTSKLPHSSICIDSFGDAEGTAMGIRMRFVILTMCCLFVGIARTRADDGPKTDLNPLLAEVRKLVEKHYPKAKVTLKDQTIHFEFNIRKFMIHALNRIGDAWQDAHEEQGPQPGGIYGDIELRQGKYGGAAGVPQDFNERYFTLYLSAPYSKKLDRHLYIHLKYPGNVPKEFLRDFKRLTDEFEAHVSDTAK
jgi:hypothetical protein